MDSLRTLLCYLWNVPSRLAVNKESQATDASCVVLQEEQHVIASLPDLPGPCLLQLLARLDQHARLQLFQTCVFMRDLVLSQRSVRLHFQPPFNPSQAAAARISLHRTCELSPAITLRLQGVGKPEDVNVGINDFMTFVMGALGRGLAEIKSAQLEVSGPEVQVAGVSSTSDHVARLPI